MRVTHLFSQLTIRLGQNLERVLCGQSSVLYRLVLNAFVQALLLCFQKSVNALLAVRRMSLSPLFAAKRRSSMDPSMLKSTAESEEEQIVDRKVSAPIDPAGLGLSSRRHCETRSSCFDLDMDTIKALQEKADKAMGKVSSQREESDGEGESYSEDEKSDDGSDMEDNCSEEEENEDESADECSKSVSRESGSSQRPRANTVCGATSYHQVTSQRERKTSQLLISVGNASKNDFKPVSFTFNTEELQKNNLLISESKEIHNNQSNSKDLKQNGDGLPRICVNDELIVTSPTPIAVTLTNNIEKMDKKGLETTPSLQTSSSLNFADVNKISDGVQAITVNLGNLNGVQFTSGHVTCAVRRSSTGSAPC